MKISNLPPFSTIYTNVVMFSEITPSGILLNQGNSLVLHCASLLHTIFASLARGHGRVHQQNVRDFPQTKLDSEINSPFFLNERGDRRLYFQVFSKSSLIKNIFEEEKGLIV